MATLVTDVHYAIKIDSSPKMSYQTCMAYVERQKRRYFEEWLNCSCLKQTPLNLIQVQCKGE